MNIIRIEFYLFILWYLCCLMESYLLMPNTVAIQSYHCQFQIIAGGSFVSHIFRLFLLLYQISTANWTKNWLLGFESETSLWDKTMLDLFLVGVGDLGVTCSRSKLRGFKPGWDRWIFSGRNNPEHKSSGKYFKSWVPSLRLVDKPQAWQNRPLRKI